MVYAALIFCDILIKLTQVYNNPSVTYFQKSDSESFTCRWLVRSLRPPSPEAGLRPKAQGCGQCLGWKSSRPGKFP